MTQHYKHPKTFHFSWSEGLQNDDRLLPDDEDFIGQLIVVTEKLDGENTSMYRDYIHARSLDSRHHISRDWVKALHARIRSDIPPGWRVVGENLYAKHSIFYDQLPSYFFVFSIWDENNFCLDWGATREWCELIGLHTVPELYCGPYDIEVIQSLFTGKSRLGGEQEGYVARTWDGFPFCKFQSHVAKFVRKGHIQTDENWMTKPVEPNRLCPVL